MIDLIYTAANNARFLEICNRAQWLLGIRSDKYPCAEVESVQFVDVDYNAPSFARHVEMVKRFRPRYATVPDLSDQVVSSQDIMRALRQADILAPYCEVVLIVPKLSGQIAALPKDSVIGYSMPTAYGAAQYPLWELEGHGVHLLGGSPHAQLHFFRHISCFTQVKSLDGNMWQKMSGYGRYWNQGKWVAHAKRKSQDANVSYECLTWSLCNIRNAWLSYFHRNTRCKLE